MEKIKTSKLPQDHLAANTSSLLISQQRNLSSKLNEKKLERQAKECVLNYFNES